ncbi:hypothetical protein CsatB_004176 [Cannabis sativa]|uniref:uncharacterized protein LOC115698871 isoform X1 n=1 Tax=Cannabis sativa TaxID=3483 RepID=UPI0029CA30B7|nr:uncharacterized protein LOC115698871 isoform X1 [Cannabis sativa]
MVRLKKIGFEGRGKIPETVHQSFAFIFKQRREELESDNDGLTLRRRFELDATLNIIKEVEAPNVNEFGYEETYSGLTSQLCDLESGEDYLLRVKSYIEASTRRHKEHIQVELSKTDAKLMRNINIMEQLKLKLCSLLSMIITQYYCLL